MKYTYYTPPPRPKRPNTAKSAVRAKPKPSTQKKLTSTLHRLTKPPKLVRRVKL